jgi:imidazolonepropionase-like amidohydrolase
VTRLLAAESLWWDGSWQDGQVLRVGDDVSLVPDRPDGVDRRPGTLLPGLTDHHVHSALVDLPTVRAGGIGAVWDLGGVPEKVADLARRSVPAGRQLPRIRFAGPFLNAPGGYPSDRSWAPAGSWRSLRSPSEAEDAVGEAHRGGATLIKMTAHAGGPLLSLETMTAVAEAAHALELPVVVHAEGDGTVASALDCGADFLAHTPWTAPLDEGLARACAARMTWISTLDIHGWGTKTPESATAVGNLRQFLSYGGSVRYGTDLGNGPLPPAINPREIRLLQSTGLSPAEILTSMAGPGVTWIAAGLDLDPARFADVLATARVLS